MLLINCVLIGNVIINCVLCFDGMVYILFFKLYFIVLKIMFKLSFKWWLFKLVV